MEWFKHKTDMHDDPVVSAAMDEYGDAAYVVWCILLELYGRQYNAQKPDNPYRVNKVYLARKFRKRWTKVALILNYYAGFNKLSVIEGEKHVVIRIANFAKILSNWSKRQLCRPTEGPTEAPTAENKNKNKNKNKERAKSEKYSASFERLWGAYPNGSGKAKAYEAFLKICSEPEEDETVKFLIGAISNQSAYRRVKAEKNEFVAEWPHLSTWLNQKRWEDEIKTHVEQVDDLAARRAKAEAQQAYITGEA